MASQFAKVMKDIGLFIVNSPGFLAASLSKIFLGNPDLKIEPYETSDGKTLERTYQWVAEKNEWEKKGPTSFLDKLRINGVLGSIALLIKETVSFVVDAFSYITKGISAFVNNHSKAITIGFWSSLILAGLAVAIAASVFYISVPAYAAFASWSLWGVSIQSMASAAGAAGFLGELGIIAGLGAALATVGTVIIASIVNTIEWIKSCCRAKVTPPDDNKPNSDGDAPDVTPQPKPQPQPDVTTPTPPVVTTELKEPHQPPRGTLFEKAPEVNTEDQPLPVNIEIVKPQEGLQPG